MMPPANGAPSASPIDLTGSSPPEAKTSRTSHSGPASRSTFPTPSRPRPPRQMQLTSFLGSPSANSATKKATPKSSAKKKGKNASILTFFKPVDSSKPQKLSGKDPLGDELFLAHGAYELDVTDPEDNEDDSDIEMLWGGPEERRKSEDRPQLAWHVGQLELSKDTKEVHKDVQMEEAPPIPLEGEEKASAASAPVTPVPTPKANPKPDLSAVKLDLSSSMLFKKPPVPEKTTIPEKDVTPTRARALPSILELDRIPCTQYEGSEDIYETLIEPYTKAEKDAFYAKLATARITKELPGEPAGVDNSRATVNESPGEPASLLKFKPQGPKAEVIKAEKAAIKSKSTAERELPEPASIPTLKFLNLVAKFPTLKAGVDTLKVSHNESPSEKVGSNRSMLQPHQAKVHTKANADLPVAPTQSKVDLPMANMGPPKSKVVNTKSKMEAPKEQANCEKLNYEKGLGRPKSKIDPLKTMVKASNARVDTPRPKNKAQVLKTKMGPPKFKLETPNAKAQHSATKTSPYLRGLYAEFGKTGPTMEGMDEIQDFTQTQDRRSKLKRKREVRPMAKLSPIELADDPIGTFSNPTDSESEYWSDEYDDGYDEEDDERRVKGKAMRYEDCEPTQITQANFDFDPAARAVEGGSGYWEDVSNDVAGIKMEKSSQYYHGGPKCPICAISLSGLSEKIANTHVNRCLDGGGNTNLTSSTSKEAVSSTTTPTTSTPTQGISSAFTKIMSFNTEARAWASAAAAEASSKGKRASERSCPFYKILYNGPITVDAFRFGKIPGCVAYFLSHFHSDHYVGLSSKWDHGPIYCSRATANLVRSRLRVDPKWVVELPWETWVDIPGVKGVRVQGIDANHCPGSMMFVFEKTNGKRILHCGDFRAEEKHLRHPLLRGQRLDEVYLDTTYLNPKYAFPPQKMVVDACAQLCVGLSLGSTSSSKESPGSGGGGISSFLSQPARKGKEKGRLLIVVGTYSIGKERIAVGIAKALSSKIYAPANKLSTLHQLEDPVLTSLLTPVSADAQVHLTPLGSIDPDSLASYLSSHPAFSRIVAFKPSGWNYKPPSSRLTTTTSIEDVLYSPAWRTGYKVSDMAPARGANERVSCYLVPYSEHSSFRELSIFCCALDIVKILPTVNVGSKKSREKMAGWVKRWEGVRKKGGWRLVEDGGVGVW
ncbi:hypothetical protein FN846DRAFT_2896 [Sphaerosporella brunnea]|uniref:Metallo-beta-lactamase domain-containing protein n=1 Tax=Sphaerosporella brunnea TaxID=1250544 RepID=A0A5J5FBI1_9PEZI|nr:hypothetical protein FN846DRAFT_2896 [Sphaerosporella brunnea]